MVCLLVPGCRQLSPYLASSVGAVDSALLDGASPDGAATGDASADGTPSPADLETPADLARDLAVGLDAAVDATVDVSQASDVGVDAGVEVQVTGLLTPQDSFTIVADDPRGAQGVLTIDAKFTNGSIESIASIRFEVSQIRAGDLLLNADGGPGGLGAEIAVPDQVLGSDGKLTPNESFGQVFEVALESPGSAPFYVEVYGVIVP